jgi:CubicO group peptidase (beta-lactamase class C family)
LKYRETKIKNYRWWLCASLASAVLASILVVPVNTAMASDADDYSAIASATLDAYVGKTGFYGANAAVQFSDGSRWIAASGVTGPTSSSNGGRALTTSDRFHIGSQTKTYTGTTILQYLDSGVLNLDQTINDWLPGLTVMNEAKRKKITIRDLITMRSGIGDYLGAPDPNNSSKTVLASWNALNGQYELSREQLIEAALKRPETMTPGDTSTFAYTNTNFTLLGMIAEKASCNTSTGCKTIDKIINENIVAKLGLTDTTFPTSNAYVGPHTNATWNMYGTLTDFTNATPAVPNSAGAMISTITNQLDWLIELTTNAAGTLSASTFADRKKMTTNLDGTVAYAPSGYGMALYGSTSHSTGATILGHGGEISGLQTLMFQFPDSNLFMVGDLNTFLSVPNDRTKPADQITGLYYGIERAITTATAAATSGGSCLASSSGTNCTGTSVTATGHSATGEVNIEASGNYWTNTSVSFSAPIPTVIAYGANVTGMSATDAIVSLKTDAILESIGNNSTALKLNGTTNTVDISGQLLATGGGVTAIDGSASSSDTITIKSTGVVTGDVKLTSGTDKITVNGTMTGDISLGTNGTVTGGGTINGLITGGTIAPGNSVGTLTVGRYEGTSNTLTMEVDGATGTADKLNVVKQTVEGFDVVGTGVAVLTGGTMNLSGSRPSDNTRLVLLAAEPAVSSLSGTLASITDANGILAKKGRISGNVLTGTNSVVATWTSPAPFDAAAGMAYLSSLNRAEDALGRLARVNNKLARQDGARAHAGVLGDHASFKSDDSVAGFKVQTAGLTAGFDVPISNNILIGLDISSTSENAQVKNSGRDQEGQILGIGLHGDIDMGAYNIGATLAFGGGDIDYSRAVTIDGTADIANGTYNHKRISVGLNITKTVERGDWDFDLSSSLVYMRGEDKGFTETGIAANAAMTFDERTYERLRAGVEATFRDDKDSSVVHPWVSVGVYQHFDLNQSDSSYRLSSGGSVGLEGRDADGFEGRLGAGVSHQLTDDIRMNLGAGIGLREEVTSARVSLRFSIPLGD